MPHLIKYSKKLIIGGLLIVIGLLCFFKLVKADYQINPFTNKLDRTNAWENVNFLNVTSTQFCLSTGSCVTSTFSSSQWITNGSDIYYLGRVGIGTSTPTSILTLIPISTSTSQKLFDIYNGSKETALSVSTSQSMFGYNNTTLNVGNPGTANGELYLYSKGNLLADAKMFDASGNLRSYYGQNWMAMSTALATSSYGITYLGLGTTLPVDTIGTISSTGGNTGAKFYADYLGNLYNVGTSTLAGTTTINNLINSHGLISQWTNDSGYITSSILSDYLYLPGRAGGQTAFGGVNPGEGLNLFSNPIGGGYINLDPNFNINPVGVAATGSLYVTGVNDMPQFMVTPKSIGTGGQYSPTMMLNGVYGQPFVTLLSQPEILLVGDAPAISSPVQAPLFMVARSSTLPVNIAAANEGYGTTTNINIGLTNALSTVSAVDPTSPPTHATIIGRSGPAFDDPNFALVDKDSSYFICTNGNCYLGSTGTTTNDGNIYFFAGGRDDKKNISGVFTYDNKFGVGQALANKDLDVAGHLNFQQIVNPINTSTASLAGVAGSVDVGSHSYKYAYVASGLGETQLSTAATNIVTVTSTSNAKINLTNIPQSPDKRVTQIRIYRTKVGSASLYYLVTTVNTGVTTYTDNATDASLGTPVWNFKENSTAGLLYLNNILSGRWGIQNTSFGYVALSNLTSGYDNVTYGNSSGRFITSAQGNTLFGARSGGALTTGGFNLCLGSGACESGVTLAQSVNVGINSGNSTLSGLGMTNVGYNALATSVTSTGMTAIGYEAGNRPNNVAANASNGSTYSTFIGYEAGQSNTSTITNSIAIGKNAVVGASSTAVIGGTGVDAVSVAIGRTVASSTLDVNGSFSTAYQLASVSTTLTATSSKVEVNTTGVVITLPTATDITGREYHIVNTSAGNITVSSTSIIGNLGTDTTLTVGSGNAPSFFSNGTKWLIF